MVSKTLTDTEVFIFGSKSDAVSVVKNFDLSSKYPDPKIVERFGLKSIIMSLSESVVG